MKRSPTDPRPASFPPRAAAQGRAATSATSADEPARAEPGKNRRTSSDPAKVSDPAPSGRNARSRAEATDLAPEIKAPRGDAGPQSRGNVRRKVVSDAPPPGEVVARGRDANSNDTQAKSKVSGPGLFARVRASRALYTGVSVLRSAFGVALAIAAAAALAMVGHRYVTTSPRFALREVHVTGGAVHDEASLLRLIGTESGKNLFSVDLAAGRRKLEADPWIAKAEVARTLPGTLDIRITERKAAALVACGETFLATREGELFKVVDDGDKIDLPVVTGLDAEMLTADRKGAEARVARALDAASEYEHHPLAQRWTLEEIHVEPDEGVTLIVGKQAITLALGHAPWRKKLDEAFAIAGELDRRGKKPDVVMLDNDARPERVVVRMR